MKKLLLLLFASTLIFTACKKKDKEGEEDVSLAPTQEQRGFAINYTAKWCSPCGSWGAPLIHDYAEDAPDGVIICAHAYNDPMNNNLFSSFSADRITNGVIPSFWVGDNYTTSANAMTTLLNQSAVAGVDYKYEIDNNQMKIDTKVKFFDADQGDYYLSVLVLEDGIDGSASAGSYAQAGTSQSDYHHDFVLRSSSISGSAYGDIIATDPTQGKEIDNNFTIDLDASWNTDNLYAVCIIWKWDSSGQKPFYKYVNSLKKK